MNELNRYLKDLRNTKLMMKTKSAIGREKSEENRILSKEDIKYKESYNSRNNKLKNVIEYNLEPMNISLPNKKNYNPFYSSNNSNKELENFPSNNNKKKNITTTNLLVAKKQEDYTKKLLNHNTSYNRSESPSQSNPNASTNFKTYPLIDSSYIVPQQTTPKEIKNSFELTTTLQLPNKHKKIDSKSQNEIADYVIDKTVTHTEIKSHFGNYNDTNNDPSSTKRTNKEFMIKRDSETVLSNTTATRTETSNSERYNSRINDNKIINQNELIVAKQKNELRNSVDKEVKTDDFINFPKLSQNKKENFQMVENKKQISEHINEIKMVDESLKFDNNERVNKKIDLKSVPVSLDFVPLDRKNLKQQEKVDNKLNISIDGNFDKKVKLMSNEVKRRSVFEVILTPQYGTVSFIAQRFEKIDIDEWRVDY